MTTDEAIVEVRPLWDGSCPDAARKIQAGRHLADEVERLRDYVRDQFCECYDEYGTLKANVPCVRCRLLGEEAAKAV
jgi:hypothetical protein